MADSKTGSSRNRTVSSHWKNHVSDWNRSWPDAYRTFLRDHLCVVWSWLIFLCRDLWLVHKQNPSLVVTHPHIHIPHPYRDHTSHLRCLRNHNHVDNVLTLRWSCLRNSCNSTKADTCVLFERWCSSVGCRGSFILGVRERSAGISIVSLKYYVVSLTRLTVENYEFR